MENTNQELQSSNQELELVSESPLNTYGAPKEFAHAQRLAMALSAANVIPEAYRNNIPNCLIALEMANRMKISPIMVMQNLHIVKGKPSWSGSFVIAMLNSCGRFTPMKFDMQGKDQTLSCMAYTNDAKTGERINGTRITMAMAISEGWVNKEGSKWKTMPEQMIQYRAGAFFGRVHAADIIMGMQTTEEIQDVFITKEITLDQVTELYHELCDNGKLAGKLKDDTLYVIQNKIAENYKFVFDQLKNLK